MTEAIEFERNEKAAVTAAPAWVRAIDRVTLWAVGIAAVVTALMAVNVIADVASRTLTRQPLPGTIDLVSVLWMPTLALMAMGYAQLNRQQINVELFIDATKPAANRALQIFGEILTGALMLWLTFLLSQELLHAIQIGESAVTSRWLPTWPGRLMLVISLFVCFLSCVARLYLLFTHAPDGEGRSDHGDD